MSETSNIAKMAEKISSEIFEILGWTRVGPINQNWPCVKEEHQKSTHPSDIVFFYDDPYKNKRIFWNTDLKSYSSQSITKQTISRSISSLSKAVECANVCNEWQNLYVNCDDNFLCNGLLFIYNHSRDLSKNFDEIIFSIDESSFKIAPGRLIAIFGPDTISYLLNITTDLRLNQAKHLNDMEYWYPDLVRLKKTSAPKSAATIEMLTSAWLTILIPPNSNNETRKFLIYYRDKGSTIEEFKYLLDSFFRFQMLSLDKETIIDIKLTNSEHQNDATNNFLKAKESISNSMYGLAQNPLQRVTCSSISHYTKIFSEIEIGME